MSDYPDRHHTVMYCPKCRRQRTWTSYDTYVFICDHIGCGVRLRWNGERWALV